MSRKAAATPATPSFAPTPPISFFVDRDDFAAALAALGPSIPKPSSVGGPFPAVLLTASDAGVDLASTTTRITIRRRVAANVLRLGSIAVAAADLKAALAAMPEPTVEIKTEPSRIRVTSGKASVLLQAIPAEDHALYLRATTPAASWAPVPRAAALAALKAIKHAPAEDHSRGLGGVYLHRTDDGFRVVGTDGSRLAFGNVAGQPGPEMPRGSLIPRDFVAPMLALLGWAQGETVEAAVHDGFLLLRAGEGMIIEGRLLETEFPEYQTILPRSHQMRAVCDRAQLAALFTRARAFVTSPMVRVEIGDAAIRVSASGDRPFEDEIPVTEFDGEPRTLGLNVGFALEAAAALASERVAICANRPLEPVVLRDAERTALLSVPAAQVVMPMRLD